MINNLQKYKRALIYTKDLEKLLTVLTKFENELHLYRKYFPAAEVLSSINDAKMTVKIHLEHNKKVVENKGL